MAEELREIMASLGFRNLNEMVGHSEVLKMGKAIAHYKARGLDFSKILYKPQVPEGTPLHKTIDQDHGLDQALDNKLIQKCAAAIEQAEPIHFKQKILNVNRTCGTMLSAEISRKYGEAGLPDGTIKIDFNGNAGQSFGAFLVQGVQFSMYGDANDYFGKGLSGGRLIIQPQKESTFAAEKNVIIGNVALFGATRGEAYIRGMAWERFAVRNSGARAIVEGVGDHGCEYMTGGCVVCIGHTGRNFAAGMSGGIAYVLDEAGDFSEHRCNHELVDLEDLVDPKDVDDLRGMLEAHQRYTRSAVASKILDDWEEFLPKFIKVMPRDYKLALERLAREREAQQLQIEETSEALNLRQN